MSRSPHQEAKLSSMKTASPPICLVSPSLRDCNTPSAELRAELNESEEDCDIVLGAIPLSCDWFGLSPVGIQAGSTSVLLIRTSQGVLAD
jgi:hypothetical protein